ncbi:hypothetical protein CBR_g1199 [Chara braunii]|uniref:Uncharacterized protein n=1 Tax=Chara braunii TaxID=69332 RepID=A0A388KDD6_CHABU|nr:hypothetical protein CBR_g1199 [Chara braunii]|eukprot:GBG68078.1 hypothetical protein CBR_g1199 [Chara braunii]
MIRDGNMLEVFHSAPAPILRRKEIELYLTTTSRRSLANVPPPADLCHQFSAPVGLFVKATGSICCDRARASMVSMDGTGLSIARDSASRRRLRKPQRHQTSNAPNTVPTTGKTTARVMTMGVRSVCFLAAWGLELLIAAEDDFESEGGGELEGIGVGGTGGSDVGKVLPRGCCAEITGGGEREEMMGLIIGGTDGGEEDEIGEEEGKSQLSISKLKLESRRRKNSSATESDSSFPPARSLSSSLSRKVIALLRRLACA